MSLPNDSNSLLVPIHVHAWVADAQTQQVLARYEPDYSQLASFNNPFPDPVIPGVSPAPGNGIYLHWALPDALTHAEMDKSGRTLSFPSVPNRWLVLRCTPGDKTGAEQKAWVIQSDYTTPQQTTPSFLDPNNPSTISNDGTAVTVHGAAIGKNYTVQAWQAQGDPGTANYFLKAVAPGNVSFAAYQPYCNNVFSFTDQDLPAEGTGLFHYSYLVVGWYSDGAEDPLVGATDSQTFQQILTEFRWSLPAGTTLPNDPPVSSLYHGFLADVQWPFDTAGNVNIKNVDVAIGNTAADAMAALIRNYALVQSKEDPTHQNSWITAGNTLCNLVQAAMLQLLDDYGKPGGTLSVEQQVEKSWFGKTPGGTIWKVAAVTASDADFNVAADGLTPQQNQALLQQLSALNAAQQQYDTQQRHLQSLQQQLYMLWLDLAQSLNFTWGMNPTTSPGWLVLQPVLQNNLYPGIYNQVWQLYHTQAAALAKLPNTVKQEEATKWADAQWSFPAAEGNGTVTLSGLKLVLKNTAAPGFLHPVDPVVLVCGAGRTRIHGEDGRHNDDGTLTVRLGAQTINGLQVNNEPAITATALRNAGMVFDTLGSFNTIPAITNLATEIFICDPLNSQQMAAAVPGTNAGAINTCITNLLDQNSGSNTGSFTGTAPSPVAYNIWQQAWAPLWMEWMVNYYPTQDANMNFEMDSWAFDGMHYSWTGQGFPSNPGNMQLSGRAVVSAYAQNTFTGIINAYLKDHPAIDSPQLDTMIQTVMNWDILAQSLNGMTTQLVTLLPQTSFIPPVSGNPVPPLPVDPSPKNGPPVGDLVQQQYQYMPQVTTTLNNCFFPVRGALASFAGLQLVDAFGQTYQLNQNNTPQGFAPLISPSLTPPASKPLPDEFYGSFMLGPRLAQSTRLNLDFLANDGSGPLPASSNDNPICGWLLPNHPDNSLDVYDENGILLGELMPLPAPFNWRPRPGDPGNDPPPQTPAAIQNTALKNVVVTLAAQTIDVLADFIKVIDETIWTTDPPGSGSDPFISTLMGRPLAVTLMNVSLELNGNTFTSQLWNDMLTPGSTTNQFTPVHNTGGVETVPFPVRLGSLQLRNDGLMGYFLDAEIANNTFPYFYCVHDQPGLSAGDQFIRPVVDASNNNKTYNGNLYVHANAYNQPPVPVQVTLITDPLGVVHGYTGIIPVTTAALPAYEVQQFLKKMQVNFQTGPILAGAATLRTPIPAEKQGTWNWLQQVHTQWTQSPIVDADDAARFPLQPPVIREGWLQLKGINKDD